MLPTPDTSHVSFATIYEPAEDSFLLLDTLSQPSETAWLQTRFSPASSSPPPLVLEVGPGSGVVIAFLSAHAQTIFGSAVLSFAVDVNADAARATRQTVQTALRDERAASVYLGSLRGDLCEVVKKGSVDVLVFNPPYVPSERVPGWEEGREESAFERESRLLELSYAGGKDGMETTVRLLDQLAEVLSTRGVAYVLLCRQNKPDEVKAGIRGWNAKNKEDQADKQGEWFAETVGTSGKKAGWEKLEIVRIWREYSTTTNG